MEIAGVITLIQIPGGLLDPLLIQMTRLENLSCK